MDNARGFYGGGTACYSLCGTQRPNMLGSAEEEIFRARGWEESFYSYKDVETMRYLWLEEHKFHFNGVMGAKTKKEILDSIENWVKSNPEMEDYYFHYAGHGTVSGKLTEWSGMMCASDYYLGIEEVLQKISYYSSGYTNKFGNHEQPRVWVILDNCGAQGAYFRAIRRKHFFPNL